MDRTSQHPALVIHTTAFGESHAYADLLTADRGFITATAYGVRSQRGSLRGKVIPFTLGTAYLYYAPRSATFKITDFDVTRYTLIVRESIEAYYHASLWAEVLRRTHGGGGDDPEAFLLTCAALEQLAVVGGTATSGRQPFTRLTAQWIWRYARLLGVQPELPPAASRRRWFSPGFHGFTDRPAAGSALELLDRTAQYLHYTDDLDLKDAWSVPCRPETARNLLQFIVILAQDLVHGPLNTLSAGWSAFSDTGQ